jgi:vanillate/4-hydroxybenzoate decarboxylase subunit D
MTDSVLTACPRCLADEKSVRHEHSAAHDGELLWSVLHCTRCSFTWRTSEPPASIDPMQRAKWAQMTSVNPADYRVNIPPAK